MLTHGTKRLHMNTLESDGHAINLMSPTLSAHILKKKQTKKTQTSLCFITCDDLLLFSVAFGEDPQWKVEENIPHVDMITLENNTHKLQ